MVSDDLLSPKYVGKRVYLEVTIEQKCDVKQKDKIFNGLINSPFKIFSQVDSAVRSSLNEQIKVS